MYNTKKIFNHKYIMAIFLYIFGFLFLFSTPSIKDSGARIFPYILSISTIVSATILSLRTYYNLDREKDSVDFSGTLFVLFIVFILICYILLIEIIGFYVSSLLFLCLLMWLLGQKNIKLILILSTLSVLIIYVFFGVLLGLKI